MDEPPPPFDEATAYHEAGHAVVALALDRPVHRVSVLANRDRLGQCEFAKGRFRPTEDWVEREVLIALAGPAAALPGPPPTRCPMRLLAACLAAACGAALSAPAAPVPKDKQKTTAEKLVGTWELVKNSKGNVEGLTVYVEFTKDGKMAVK